MLAREVLGNPARHEILQGLHLPRQEAEQNSFPALLLLALFGHIVKLVMIWSQREGLVG